MCKERVENETSISKMEEGGVIKEDTVTKEGVIFKQLICAFVINLVALLQGASVSSSSVILWSLQEEVEGFNSSQSSALLHFDFGVDFTVSFEEGSWVASSWILGHLLCAPVAGFISDKIGRRKALIMDTIVFLCGFVILAMATSVPFLMLARFLHGCPLVSQVYVCEIVSPYYRGLAAALYSVLHAVGFSMMLLLGASLHWRFTMTVLAVMVIPILIGISWLRESPHWLTLQGRLEEARDSANFYSLEIPDSAVITETQTQGNNEDSCNTNIMKKMKALLRTLSQQGKQFWKDLAFLSVLFVLVGWSGFSILSCYAVEVFQRSGSPISAEHTSWITSTTKIVCGLTSFYFLHRFTRKRMLLVTSTIIFLSFLVVSVYTHLTASSLLPSHLATSLNFIPMVTIILAYMGYGLGFGVIPSLLAAEYMPVVIRSTSVGFLVTLEMSSNLLLSMLKPLLISQLGIQGLFTMFTLVVAVVILLTHTALSTHRIDSNNNSGSKDGAQDVIKRKHFIFERRNTV